MMPDDRPMTLLEKAKEEREIKYLEIEAAMRAKHALRDILIKYSFTSRISKCFERYQKHLDEMMEVAAQEYLEECRKVKELGNANNDAKSKNIGQNIGNGNVNSRGGANRRNV